MDELLAQLTSEADSLRDFAVVLNNTRVNLVREWESMKQVIASQSDTSALETFRSVAKAKLVELAATRTAIVSNINILGGLLQNQ